VDSPPHNVNVGIFVAAAAGPAVGANVSVGRIGCAKFTPLNEFSANSAHSNLLYGFRVHPAYVVSP
jgi:hypothetical protein